MATATQRRRLRMMQAELAKLAAERKALWTPDRPSSLAEFAARFLRAEAAGGSLIPLTPQSELHRWLAAELDGWDQARGQRLAVLAPRGAAKTTWSTFAFPLWAAVRRQEPYIVLTSDTGDQAHGYLEAIRRELETNEALARAYPAACGAGDVWRGGRLRLRNGVVIEAYGTGAKLRGRKSAASRPSLIILDDPQNKDHVLSAVQRERTWQWLARDVLNAGSPRTNVLALGTALHREGIVCRLQSPEFGTGWRVKVFRSVVAWPAHMDLWREWEGLLREHENPDREVRARAFYEQRRGAMDEGARVLWPEREQLYQLMQLRAAIGGAAFESEKQNNPVDPSLCEWPDECFTHPNLWFDRWPDRLACKTIGIDPSKGRDAKHGDYSAIVKYGVTWEGVEYCEADLRQGRTVDVICGDAAAHARSLEPDGVYLEPAGWQELLAGPLLEAMRQTGVNTTIDYAPDHAAKEVRIRRLTEAICQRRIRFKSRSPGTALLVQQLRDFPNGSFDDGPDALEMSRRLAIRLLRKRRAPHQVGCVS